MSIIDICSQFSPYYCSLWIWSSHWRRRRILYRWITTGIGLPWSKCLILARTTSTRINCWLQLLECNLSSDKRQSLSSIVSQTAQCSCVCCTQYIILAILTVMSIRSAAISVASSGCKLLPDMASSLFDMSSNWRYIINVLVELSLLLTIDNLITSSSV